jgi:hypothetical protein
VSEVSVIYSLSRKIFLWFSGGQELEMDEFSARLAEVGGPGEREQGLLNLRKSRHLRQTRHQIVRYGLGKRGLRIPEENCKGQSLIVTNKGTKEMEWNSTL